MAEPESMTSSVEEPPSKKDAKRPYKRKHEPKKLAEIQNKYVLSLIAKFAFISHSL